MKVEKETFFAILAGALIGFLITFLGSYVIGEFYLLVHSAITVPVQIFGSVAWYFYITLIICAVTFVGTELIIEHYNLEVLFKFIVPFIVIEINMHVFTFIYMLACSFNFSLFWFMHLILFNIFLISLSTILFYIIYDKWRDPALFLGVSYAMTILVSLLINYFTLEILFFWVFKIVIISGIYGVTICAVLSSQE
ncbi:MAG: hypothetical protein EAX96_19105 [Candidatus Lokiarchaeota archaeon]|nr:hypothetical protein [Candidatus Lokiarchaeota archaeon]